MLATVSFLTAFSVILSEVYPVDAIARVTTFNDAWVSLTLLPLCSMARNPGLPAQVRVRQPDFGNGPFISMLPADEFSKEWYFPSAMSELSPLWMGAPCQGRMLANGSFVPHRRAACNNCIGRV